MVRCRSINTGSTSHLVIGRKRRKRVAGGVSAKRGARMLRWGSGGRGPWRHGAENDACMNGVQSGLTLTQ